VGFSYEESYSQVREVSKSYITIDSNYDDDDVDDKIVINK